MIPFRLRFLARYRRFYMAVGDSSKVRGSALENGGSRIRGRFWLKIAREMSWLDLVKVGFASRRLLYFSYFSCVLGIVGTFVLAPVSWNLAGLVGVIGVVTGVVGVVIELKGVKRKNLEVRIVAAADDLTDLVPEACRIVHRNSLVLYDRDLVRQVADDSRRYREHMRDGARAKAGSGVDGPTVEPLLTTTLARDPRALSHRIPEEYQFQILLHLFKTSSNRPYNNYVVGQVSSLADSVADPTRPVEFAPASYFDLVRSNYLVAYDVYLRSTGERIIRGRDLITDDTGRLEALRDSFLTNAVGVSTLAFDIDRRLVVVSQADDALSERGLLAPSGSGSLEPVDLERGGQTLPLAEVIARGMNRELCEEANIAYADIDWSEVTGGFRWITKGAKPEYVGVTVLNKRTNQLKQKVRWVEKRYVDTISVGLVVDFDALAADPTRATEALAHPWRDRCSVPLAVALRALGERLQDERFAAEFRPPTRQGFSSPPTM